MRISVALAAITFAIGGCELSGITFADSGGFGGGGFGPICGSTPTVARIRVQPSQVNLRLGFQVWIEAMPLDSLGQVAYCAPIPIPQEERHRFVAISGGSSSA